MHRALITLPEVDIVPESLENSQIWIMKLVFRCGSEFMLLNSYPWIKALNQLPWANLPLDTRKLYRLINSNWRKVVRRWPLYGRGHSTISFHCSIPPFNSTVPFHQLEALPKFSEKWTYTGLPTPLLPIATAHSSRAAYIKRLHWAWGASSGVHIS